MQPEPLRIGVVGAGAFGQRHIAIAAKEPMCRIVAIADPAPAAIALAQRAGFEHYAVPDDMLDNGRLDAVIIATPNATHAPIGLACAARGIHMLVEKPIAETVEAAAGLARAAESAGVVLLVGHHRRYNPMLEKAREIVRSGRLGRLTAIAAMWMLQKPDDYFSVAWRTERPGGGPILINLIHDIDDLRYVCGEIESVAAMTGHATRALVVEDSAAISLRFVEGAIGTVTVSDCAAAPWSWEITTGESPLYPQRRENCYLISGTEGSLTVPKLELWRYLGEKGWYAPLSRETIDVASADPLARQIRHFCRAIRGEETPRISGTDATRTLAVALAVTEASRTGRTINLD